MVANALTPLFQPDVQRVGTAIEDFPNAASRWGTSGTISNSTNTPCQHLRGNVQYLIGAVRGLSGVMPWREKALAFSHSIN